MNTSTFHNFNTLSDSDYVIVQCCEHVFGLSVSGSEVGDNSPPTAMVIVFCLQRIGYVHIILVG